MSYLSQMRAAILVFLFSLILITVQAQTFYGRTTGLLPYLNYGLGTDRLGGAKMTYLDTNVLVQVVDSAGRDYKVKLSGNHYAYLPKIFYKTDTSIRLQPQYLTASWRVWGDEKYDYVSIGLPERLPYSSLQRTGPSQVVVDIYGAVTNTNWITQLKTVKEIKNVWYEQVEDDVFRVFIELKHQQHWGHFISYTNNTLQIRIKRQPEKLRVRGMNIAIDAGHGGEATGATGIITGAKEKDYTLLIAQQLQRLLQTKKARVFMTRMTDRDVSMTDRIMMLQQWDPDILISVHLNSSGNENVKGVSTYYRYIGFRPLSEKILTRMLELGLNNFGNVGAFNFSLSGPTAYPNALVEVAFLSNPEDEQRILDPKFHKEVAKQIYKGINDWLKAVK